MTTGLLQTKVMPHEAVGHPALSESRNQVRGAVGHRQAAQLKSHLQGFQMPTRTKVKNGLVVGFMLAVVVSTVLTAIAPSSGTANRRHVYNGNFGVGRHGWTVITPY